MKCFKHTTVLYLVISALLIIIFHQSCHDRNVKQIKTSEKTGVVVDSKPTPVITDSIHIRDSVRYIIKELIEKSEVKQQEFEKKPIKEKVEEYKKSTKINTYSKTVETEDIKISYVAVTEGSLEHLEFDYTIKPQSVEVPIHREKAHFLLGGSVTTNSRIDELSLNINAGIQTKKGNLIYATYGTDKSVQVGYMFKIF